MTGRHGMACGVSLAAIELRNCEEVDAVEVVRCRDCIYAKDFNGKRQAICAHPSNNAWDITAEHYCGYGKRKGLEK